MFRAMTALLAAILLGAAPAVGQEAGGAGRTEVGLIPGGGLFFTGRHDNAQPFFGDYVVGGSIARNVNRWIGAEAEVAVGIGAATSFTFNSKQMIHQTTPDMLNISGSFVVHPVGSDRVFAPYATLGIGSLTAFSTGNMDKLGVTTETFFTPSMGGGLKWFSSTHYGLRADYRLLVMRTNDRSASFFGSHNVLRYAHRVYGGFVFT